MSGVPVVVVGGGVVVVVPGSSMGRLTETSRRTDT